MTFSMPCPAQPRGEFHPTKKKTWWNTERYSAIIWPDTIIRVEPFAESDGASIPWFIQTSFTPRFERETFAQAFIHDLLYAAELLPRWMADEIFWQQLRAGEVSEAKAKAYFLAVRGCGWYTYFRHTRASVALMRSKVRLERETQ